MVCAAHLASSVQTPLPRLRGGRRTSAVGLFLNFRWRQEVLCVSNPSCANMNVGLPTAMPPAVGRTASENMGKTLRGPEDAQHPDRATPAPFVFYHVSQRSPLLLLGHLAGCSSAVWTPQGLPAPQASGKRSFWTGPCLWGGVGCSGTSGEGIPGGRNQMGGGTQGCTTSSE